MKIDIEKLERKTPYTLPSNVFDEVQKKVIAETIPTKSTKVISIKRWWWAAASLIFMIGMGAWLFQQEEPKTITTYAKNEVQRDSAFFQEIGLTQEEKTVIHPVDDSKQLTHDTSLSQNEVAITEIKNTLNKENSVKIKSNEKAEMDEFIDSLTEEELASISANTEHDIHMDLY